MGNNNSIISVMFEEIKVLLTSRAYKTYQFWKGHTIGQNSWIYCIRSKTHE